MINELRKIGKIAKVHGLQGEMKIAVEDVYLEALFDKAYLIVDIKSQMVPYFIETIRGIGQLITKLEGINNVDDARRIAGADIYMKDRDLPPIIEDKTPEGEYGALSGYMMNDLEGNPIARIIRIDIYPMQELAVVEHQSREKLIPLNTSTVVDIDHKLKQLKVDLPDGLLDL